MNQCLTQLQKGDLTQKGSYYSKWILRAGLEYAIPKAFRYTLAILVGLAAFSTGAYGQTLGLFLFLCIVWRTSAFRVLTRRAKLLPLMISVILGAYQSAEAQNPLWGIKDYTNLGYFSNTTTYPWTWTTLATLSGGTYNATASIQSNKGIIFNQSTRVFSFVNTVTGALTPLTITNSGSIPRALNYNVATYDPASSRLFIANENSNYGHIFTVNIAANTVTYVSEKDFGQALNSDDWTYINGKVIGLDNNWVEIWDIATNTYTEINPVGGTWVGEIQGSWANADGTMGLYGENNNIYKYNPTTNMTTLVGTSSTSFSNGGEPHDLANLAIGVSVSPLIGILSKPYTGSVTGAGGVSPYTYALTAGTLPPGLSFNTSTGAITGTPTTVGSYTLTFQVTDAMTPTNLTATTTQTILIDKDSDGDGVIDSVDIDDDNDGIPDSVENKCPTYATWTDWTSITALTSATGTLPLSTGGAVTVTYTSPQVYSIQGVGGSYFNLGDAYGGTMPTTGIEGLQALHGAGLTHTYTFSQPVTNPILVFWSMNGNTFTFDKDFVVVGKTAGITVGGSRIITGTAAAECNASVQFMGTFSSISYTSSLLENWTGVTVGTNYCPDLNSDNDALVNRLDLDSDNDGCADAFEGGATSDRLTPNFKFTGNVGTNGLVDSLETTADNGVVKFTSKYNTFAMDNANNRCDLKAPGGVFTDLEFWYRPDEGVTLNAGKVSSWVDQTNGIEVTPAAAANGPTYYDSGSNLINFNPTLNFTNTTRQDGLRAATGLSAIPTGVSTFSVMMPTDAAFRWFLQWGVSGAGYYNNYGVCATDNPGVWTNSHGGCVNAPTALGPILTPSFVSSRWNSTAGTNQWQLRKNGQLHSGTTSSTVLNVPANTALEIGDVNNRTAGNEYVGNISEVIGYTSRLSDIDRQKVESYISIKYGITYMNDANTDARDYLNGVGETIWSATINAGYNNNIFAIGRDDVSALNQKQSKSVNTGVQPIFGLGSIVSNNITNPSAFSANKSFLFAGSNAGVAKFYTAITAPVGNDANYRFTRVWKVQETGTVGTVQFAVPSYISGGNTIYLVRSTDATFDATDTWIPLSTSLTVNGTTHAAANIDFNNGDFFTLAAYVGAPGCVAGNLNFWLKADAIGDGEGASLAEWQNQALSSLDSVGQVTATARPTFYNSSEANLVNFNPSVSFDGGDELTQSNRMFANTSAFTQIALAVDRRTNAGEVRAPLGGGFGSGNFLGLDFQTDGVSPYGFNPYSGVDAEWGNTTPNYRLNSLGLGATNQSGNIVGLTSNNIASGNDNVIAYVNGAKDLTTITANQNSFFGNGMYVGSSGDAQWLGLVPEVIVYDKQLTDAEIQRVYSYLAIKYGVTLKQPYVNSTGTTIYDTTGYANNIAGIGREICQTLNQKQSRSMLAGFQPTMGLTSIETMNVNNTATLTDGSFMIWGSNSGAASFGTVITPPSGATANNRFDRVWKVQETGTVGTVKFAIPQVGTGNTVYLIRSTDATFDATDTWIPLINLTVGSTTYLAGDVNFNNGDYFTIATYLTAPGGVVAGIRTWLKSDAGITAADGSAIGVWKDQSSNGYDVTHTTAGKQPLYRSSNKLVNFNPSVDFDGSKFVYNDNPLMTYNSPYTFGWMAKDSTDGAWRTMFSAENSWDYFSVYKSSAYGTASNGWIPYGIYGVPDAGYSGKGTVYSPAANSNGFWNGTNFTNNDARTKISQAQVFGMASLGAKTDPFYTWTDGYKDTPNWSPANELGPSTTFFQRFAIGADYFGPNGAGEAEDFIGQINEFYVYNRLLTDVEMQKVNTYMAIKWGTTLGQGNGAIGNNANNVNYLATDGSVVWNATTNTAYGYNIAGIGRDDTEGLNQKQSQSVNAGLQPIISLPNMATTNQGNVSTFAADKSYEIWGSDAGATSFGTAITAPAGMSANNRFTRIWKVQETGTIGLVKFAVPQVGNGGTVYLIRSTNATFDATDTWIPLSNTTIGSTTYLAADIDFNDGDYFTIATYLTSPGCVSANLNMWLKANNGVSTSTDGAPVLSWGNQATGLDSVRQTAAGWFPTYYNTTTGNLVNYNPSLSFNGSNQLVNANRLFSNTAPFSLMAFAVDRRSNAAELRAPLGLGDGNYPALDFQTDGVSPYGFNPWSSVDGEWGNTTPNYRLNSLGQGSSNQNGNIIGLTTNNISGGSDNILAYVNGAKDNTTISANQNAAFGNGIYVGSSGGEQWLGLIPEIIVYDRQLSDAEMQRVYSYLAIKYGTTLAQNYLSGSGKTIYDRSTFGNNIFGIGREDCQGLNQKQSKSTNALSKMTIGLADLISTTNAAHPAIFNQDSSFIIIGDNGLTGVVTPSVSGACPLPPSADKASAQIFKVVETGSVQSINVLFSPSGLGYNNLYPVYMQVATDAAFSSVVANVPMLWSGANVSTNYDFPANSTVYVRFMGNTTSLANICTAATAQTFHFNTWNYGTKTKDIIANYGTSANAGDMVMKATVTDGTPNVLLYRPTVDWWPVFDGWGLFYPRWGSSANQNSTITTKLQFLSQATTGAANASATKLAAQTVSFTVRDLDGYIGSRDIVKIYGKLGTATVDPKLSLNKYTAVATNFGGDPQSAIGGALPWDVSVWGDLYVTFDSPVEEVYVEYKQQATYSFSSYQDFRLSDITATCKAPTPKIVTPDNVYVYKEVASPVKSGNRATYKFTVQNLNCGDKTINFSDILPSGSGLTWADSSLATPLSIGTTNTYGGTQTLTLGNIVVPAGTSYIYVDAKTSTAGTFNNQATYSVGANNYVSDDPTVTGANSPTALTVIANDPEANLTITKAVDKATEQQNGVLTYTYTVTNPNGSAINTTVQDQLPADAAGVAPTLVAGTLTGVGSATVSPYAGTASLTIRNLSVPANGNVTFTVQANIGTYTVGDTIKNVASVVPDVLSGYRLTTKYSGSANTKVTAACAAGTATPTLSATTLSNICPATKANLGSITASNLPVGAKLTWHTATPATLANKVADSSQVATAGTYYAVFYDFTNACFGNNGASTASVTVTLNLCTTAPTASTPPAGGTSSGNAATDLAPTGGTAPYSYAIDNSGACVSPGGGAQPLPVSSNLTINSTTGAYSYTTPTTVGTYYYCIKVCDNTSPTPICKTVTYTVNVACGSGTTAPSVSATTLSNTCPATKVDLGTITASNLPAGARLTWHTATPATLANKVADSSQVATAGVYYAAFYDFANGCIGNGGASTTAVTVTINSCSASFAFDCGTSSVSGTFAANAVAGQTGSVTIPMTGATAGTATFTVTGTGFTGTLSTTLTAGQTSVSVPITYDGSGVAGSRTLTITSTEGSGSCSATATISANIASFTFNCGTASATGTFTANGTAGQSGSVTIPLTGATAGDATFTITGTGFTGSLSTTLTAGQTSVSVPITYNGTGMGGTRTLTITSAQGTGSCSVSVSVIGIPDITTTIGQPSPALVVGQPSDVPVTVKNIGTGSAPGIITTTITLPTGTSAPATFTSNGSTCATSGQTVTCTNAGPIAAGDSIKILVPVTPNASIVGTNPIFNGTTAPITGETNTGNNAATPTTVTTPVAGVPDLTTTIGQPSPALVVGQPSDVPVTVKNIGTGSAPGIITTTITLPTGTSAPATFTSNGSTCATSGQTVTCTNAGPIAAGDSIKILVPVTPNASIVGTTPTFNATTAPVTGETNTGNNAATPTTTTAVVTAATVKVSAKVFLSGSYNTVTGMMYDSLRVKGLIPAGQPYTSMGYAGMETVAPSVLTVTGANAIVDWVLVELRSDATTVVAKRAGLVQRDGDIVDVDGVTPLAFTAASGSYYVVVRHRNHLGVMSGSAIALTATTTSVDFTSLLTTNYQISGALGNVYAQRTLGTVRGLWGGNTGGGVSVKATGTGSDAEAVYFKVLLDAGNTSFSPSYIIYNIYAREDATMDGKIIYQGTNSEVDGILFNVLLHLNNTGTLPTFVIYEQIP